MASKTPELVTSTSEEEITPQGATTETTVTETPVAAKGAEMSDANKKQLAKVGLGLAGQVGNLVNYIPGYMQYKQGKKFLAETGKRPVDKLDPDFLNTVNQAQVNARFGYTPEEKTAIDQQNLSALRAGQASARNYSGGSVANALANERAALNQYFGRGLQAAVANKQLQMNKQQYADQLNAQKSEMSRRLFEDNMNAWTQNQKSGSALLGAGLQNLLGANRYNQELNFQKQLAQGENNWMKTIG
jgi:hypothetical protein